MRIGYLSVLAPPGEAAVSGVYKVSETLLKQYESLHGIEVEAIALIDGLDRERVERRGAVRYHYLPCKPKGKTVTLYMREVAVLKRRLRELEVDLVHGQPTAEYFLAATGCGLPHVITIHGLVVRENVGLRRFGLARLPGWIREALQKRAIRRAKNIISISPYVEDYLRGWVSAKIWPVANPIDPEFFELPPPLPNGLRILCVGIVSERKNQALLVRACAGLRKLGVSFECRIVGTFSPGSESAISSLIAQLGVGQEVRLLGRVEKAELLASYAWANLVVLPSREETSPLSLIQGLACGRVVLGANAAGIPLLLRAGKYGGLFAAEDPEALTAALADFAREPSLFWKVAEGGRQFAEVTFRPEAVARNTVAVYKGLRNPPA